MSSMAAHAIEMGMDPCVGPDGQEWSESSYRRPNINREVFGDDSDNDRKGYDTPLGSLDNSFTARPAQSGEDTSVKCFSTAKDAFQLAKETPGSVVKRSPDGSGFNVTLK